MERSDEENRGQNSWRGDPSLWVREAMRNAGRSKVSLIAYLGLSSSSACAPARLCTAGCLLPVISLSRLLLPSCSNSLKADLSLPLIQFLRRLHQWFSHRLSLAPRATSDLRPSFPQVPFKAPLQRSRFSGPS